MTTQVELLNGPRDGLRVEVEKLVMIMIVPDVGDEIDLELLDSVKTIDDLPFKASRYVLRTPVSRPVAQYVWDPNRTWEELYWAPSAG